jgi:hypothetical protein
MKFPQLLLKTTQNYLTLDAIKFCKCTCTRNANHLIMTALIEPESLGVLIHRFDLRLDAMGENVHCSISQNLSHASHATNSALSLR